jgi:ketol-acid reductoisomerase
MTKMYHEQDVNKDALKGKRIAVVGYGSQGRGQSLNLRDSKLDVVLGLRKGGKTWQQAESEGWKPAEVADAVDGADLVAMLVPDMSQAEIYNTIIAPRIKKGAALLFSHGFNIHYGQIKPSDDIDVIMVAPKGPGQLVRTQFEEGRGVPCLAAVAQDATGKAKEVALGYAHGVGGTRGGVIETTFGEETETDLFGEQAVLCGGATELILAGWETLVEAGYSPEVAYFECLHELKLIVDLIHEGGIARMHEFISETAKYGDLSRGPRVIDAYVKDNMREILEEIQNGEFAKEWVLENQAGKPKYSALLKRDLDHPIEKVGASLRAKMSWLKKGR